MLTVEIIGFLMGFGGCVCVCVCVCVLQFGSGYIVSVYVLNVLQIGVLTCFPLRCHH